MTATLERPPLPGAGSDRRGPVARIRRRRRPARPRPVWVEPPPGQKLFSTVLYLLGGAVFFLLVDLAFVSQLQHYVWQHNLYDTLRVSLAEGSVPVSPLDHTGATTAAGTPLALLRAPGVGIEGEVVVEGSAAAQTATGIGHRRDTVLPCQPGTSVLMARSGAYGGVGQRWKALRTGDSLTVQTGQGTCTYTVMGRRMPGDTAPPPPTGTAGRLVLTTAAGTPFMPTEVLRIDAELASDPFDRPATAIPSTAVPGSEAAMGSQLRLVLDGEPGVDLALLFGIVLLLEPVIAAGIGAVWAWRRWGRWQTWLVAAPVIGTLGLLIATSVNQWFLPNLL